MFFRATIQKFTRKVPTSQRLKHMSNSSESESCHTMHCVKFRQKLGYRLQIFKDFQYNLFLLLPSQEVTTLTTPSCKALMKPREQNLGDCSNPRVPALHLSEQHLVASHQCVKQHANICRVSTLPSFPWGRSAHRGVFCFGLCVHVHALTLMHGKS